MKIRSGFVSNSSSSSFCLYGVYLEPFTEEEKERLEELNLGLELAWSYEGYGYVGLPWYEIGGEETGNQFKARATKLLVQAGIEDKPDTHFGEIST